MDNKSTPAGSDLPVEYQSPRATPVLESLYEDGELPVTAVVPAYNERASLPRLLDCLLAASRGPGFRIDACVILDGASTDGTADAAKTWGATHPTLPLTVIQSVTRRGKAEELNFVFDDLKSEIVLCLDADITFEPSAVIHLLSHFSIPDLAVAWGACRPSRGSNHWRSRASKFQMNVVLAIQKRLPPSEPIAQGYLFALRPKLLAGFHYRGAIIADDVQLVSYSRAHCLKVVQDPNAIVERSPATSFRDFYIQTYRFYAADRAQKEDEGGHGRSGLQHATRYPISILLRQSFSDPFGCLFYVIYRLAAAIRHFARPTRFDSTWPMAETTKRRRT
jgi:glycosyltransferase involved in cell wall biosynthesis